MKIHFAYYNQYRDGIDIAFTDNTILFLSCEVVENKLKTTPHSQCMLDAMAIDNPLKYVEMALERELQA